MDVWIVLLYVFATVTALKSLAALMASYSHECRQRFLDEEGERAQNAAFEAQFANFDDTADQPPEATAA